MQKNAVVSTISLVYCPLASQFVEACCHLSALSFINLKKLRLVVLIISGPGGKKNVKEELKKSHLVCKLSTALKNIDKLEEHTHTHMFVFIYQCGKPSVSDSQTTVQECSPCADSWSVLSGPAYSPRGVWVPSTNTYKCACKNIPAFVVRRQTRRRK